MPFAPRRQRRAQFFEQAVNWAQRHIGQRNSAPDTAALAVRLYRADYWRAVAKPFRDLRELRLKFHNLKINDPLLDAAVSYSDHP